MKIVKYGLLAGGIFLLTGCVGQPSIAKIDDNEAFKYVKQYEAEYEAIKKNSNYKSFNKWIQAANKKEPCKLFVGFSPDDDRTLKDGYKIYWDGKCKNGYAYGLGREFEKGFLTDLEAIALYAGEEKEPEYFTQKDNLAHMSMEGDMNNGNFVQTIIKDDGMNFNISYRYGHFSRNPTDIVLFIESTPFLAPVTYIKGYPNFAYLIEDLTNDEFDQSNYNYTIVDGSKKQPNGFGFSVAKSNVRYCGEKQNGQMVRSVYLPQNYLNHMGTIFSEIKNAGQIAIDAQKKALMVKQQYKDAICKDNITVGFMDNKDYKNICNENQQISLLKEKMDKRLAQIEKEKEVKRAQMSQQRLIQAREAEAMAAQRQAAAAETANFNQSLQNLNNNLQMQQLNNNLMMNNLMPKRYDVYLH